jgi:hypothetical protein
MNEKNMEKKQKIKLQVRYAIAVQMTHKGYSSWDRIVKERKAR